MQWPDKEISWAREIYRLCYRNIAKGLFDIGEDIIIIPTEDREIIDVSEYKEELTQHFGQVLEVALQSAFTNEHRRQIAKGALKLMTKKDGSLMAKPAGRNDRILSI